MVALAVEVTQRGQLPADLVAQEVLEAPLPGLVDSGAVVVVSTVVSVDEVEVVEALVVIEEVSEVEVEALVAAAEAAAGVTAVDEEVSDTNRTAMGLPMVLPLVLVVPEAAVSVATEEAVATEAIVVVDGTTIDVAGVMTEDPAVLTMNRSAAGIDTATVTVDMVEAEMMARGSARTMVTATTTHEHDEGTKLDLRLSHVVQWFVKKVTSLFFAPAFFVNEGKIDSVQLLTFRLYSTAHSIGG